MCCSWTRLGRSRSQTSSRSRGRPTASSCSATRSSSTSRSREAIPRGADRSALAHVLGRDATMPADAGPLPRNHVAAASRPVPVHVGGVLRRSSRAGAGPRRPAGRCRRVAGRRHRSAAARGRRRSARTTSRPIEAEAVARLAQAIVDGGSSWVDEHGSRAPGRLGRRPDRRPVQRPGRRDQAPAAAEARVGTVDKFQGQEAPISIYSMTTSSPGAGAPRDGLPVQPASAQRRDVARALHQRSSSRRPTCSGSAPGRPSRCAWPTRSAASRSWPPTAATASRRGDQLPPDPLGQDLRAGLDLGDRDVLVGAVGDPDVAGAEDHARRSRRR